LTLLQQLLGLRGLRLLLLLLKIMVHVCREEAMPRSIPTVGAVLARIRGRPCCCCRDRVGLVVLAFLSFLLVVPKLRLAQRARRGPLNEPLAYALRCVESVSQPRVK
jgi:hypothetical protein